MGLLTREQILGIVDLPIETVKVPEWSVNGDSDVAVRGLTVGERDVMVRAWGGAQVLLDDEKSARFGSLCMVDGNGNRLFTDADVQALKRKSHIAFDRVLRVALRLSGMGPEAPEDPAKN